MSDISVDELRDRVERLESSNLRWKVFGFAAMSAVVVLLGASGYTVSQPPAQAQEPPARQAPQAGQFQVDASRIATFYANYFRVSVTPEEVILDAGVNPYTVPKPAEPIQLSHRMIVNLYTAKRLLNALQATVRQHENTFGELELDFQKRMKPK
jgi:hypothetical protein